MSELETVEQKEITCDCCSTSVPEADIELVSCGDAVCEDCLDENYRACHDCDRTVHLDDCRFIESVGDIVCDSCLDEYYFSCYRCDCIEHIDNAHTPDDADRNYCGDCAGDVLTFCDSCEMYYVDGCEACSRESFESYDFDEVLGYDTKPDDYPFLALAGEKDKKFLGVELEVELKNCKESVALDICRKYLQGKAIVKYDGSLSNGFEIVTAPMTLAYFKTKVNWRGLLKELSDAGCRSHDTDTCGLHVHVSREKAGFAKNLQVRYWIRQQIAYAMRHKLFRVSRRTQDSIGRYAEFNFRSNGRYTAVNLTNENTIEYRFFRGTLKPESFIAAVELCHALAEFPKAMPLPLSKAVLEAALDNVLWQPTFELRIREAFDKFLLTNARVYPNALKLWRK